ncbi:MAG: proteasome assembly chaperone family protein [Candidatus Nanohaloarchaeota archaeon QJJ-7]|nr:proteasome assembly chaperone family protein [Candidatus Nanohaloarchaeota archaeon QJJ-7]
MEVEHHEETQIIWDDEKPELDSPVFVEGLTGIGHIGRTAVHYLIDHLETEKVADIISHHFPHWAIVNEDKELDILKNELHVYERDDEPDLVFLIGDAQSIDPMGHYEIIHEILDILNDWDTEDLITIGGYGTGEMVEEPDVFGVVTDKELKEEYDDYGISFDHSVGQIVGGTGLLLGIGKRYGMEGIALLGETPGFLLSDPKATEEVLKILEEMLDIELDYENLEEKVEEVEEVMKRVQELQKQAQQQQQQSGGEGEGDELGYIG